MFKVGTMIAINLGISGFLALVRQRIVNGFNKLARFSSGKNYKKNKI